MDKVGPVKSPFLFAIEGGYNVAAKTFIKLGALELVCSFFVSSSFIYILNRLINVLVH